MGCRPVTMIVREFFIKVKPAKDCNEVTRMENSVAWKLEMGQSR